MHRLRGITFFLSFFAHTVHYDEDAKKDIAEFETHSCLVKYLKVVQNNLQFHLFKIFHTL